MDTLTILSTTSPTVDISIDSIHVGCRRLRYFVPTRTTLNWKHMDPAGAIAIQSQKQSASQDWQLTMASILHTMLRAALTPPCYLLKLSSGHRWIRLVTSFPSICGSKNGLCDGEILKSSLSRDYP